MTTPLQWDEIKNSKTKCIEFLNWFSTECGNHYDDKKHFETMIFLAGILQNGTSAKAIKEVAGTCYVIARSW